MDGWVYPGSGATGDSRPPHPPPAVPPAGDLGTNGSLGADGGAPEVPAAWVGSLSGDPSGIDEDPEAEFVGGSTERLPSEGPRIINVGIPGPGALRRLSFD